MKDLLKRVDECLVVRGMSTRTRQAYVFHVTKFVEFCRKACSELSAKDAEQYLLYATTKRHWSPSSRNQCAAAIRFLFEIVLERSDARQIPRAKQWQRLPSVLSGTEVSLLLNHLPSIVHRTLAILCYGAGLRISEARTLKVENIDALRKVIHICGAKGNKDRMVTLTPRMLQALRDYWKQCRPVGPYLFPGPNHSRPVGESSFQRALRFAAFRAQITKTVSPHVLRHSYATHMIEAGADLRSVQLLLGHATICSTMRYVHLTHAHRESLPNPFELLGTEAGSVFG